MYAGINTFMTFIYMKADFYQYVKSLFFRSFLESEMYFQYNTYTWGNVYVLSASTNFLADSAKFQELVTRNYRHVQHTTFANIKNEIAVIR